MTASTTMPESLKRLSDTKLVRLDGLVVVQHGMPMLFTAARAVDVVRQTHVDTYDPKTEKGYQREASSARIRAAARYYGEGNRMPNPILVNIREQDFEAGVRVVITGGDQKDYEDAIATGGHWLGIGHVEIPRDLPLWIYDGQHREGGIRELLAERSGFEDLPVPLSVALGLSSLDEMREFYDVNTNAKSVKTDLAWELLRQMAQLDPELAAELEVGGKDWITQGIEVTKHLEQLPGPWSDCIQSPNEKRTRSDRLTIPQAQFVRSLKPVLDMPLLQKADPATIAQIVNAYWQGISQVLPEPFDPTESPKDWVIQKGPGVISLHRALPRVIEVVRARGRRLGDPDGYAEVMANLTLLSGRVTDEETGETRDVSGSEFWRSGPEGVASAFTGDSGRRRLFVMIQVLLPKPSEEISL